MKPVEFKHKTVRYIMGGIVQIIKASRITESEYYAKYRNHLYCMKCYARMKIRGFEKKPFAQSIRIAEHTCGYTKNSPLREKVSCERYLNSMYLLLKELRKKFKEKGHQDGSTGVPHTKTGRRNLHHRHISEICIQDENCVVHGVLQSISIQNRHLYLNFSPDQNSPSVTVKKTRLGAEYKALEDQMFELNRLLLNRKVSPTIICGGTVSYSKEREKYNLLLDYVDSIWVNGVTIEEYLLSFKKMSA